MRFNCAQCGIDFTTAEEWMAHKSKHQVRQPEDPTPGVTCLGCAKKIPVNELQANYKGPLTCPNCNQTMNVILDGGEVVFARLG